MLKLLIPLTPPSQNHYMAQRVFTPRGRKPIVMNYPTAEAKTWYRAVSACCAGQSVEADSFEIAYVVYQGSRERGDVDNAAKCILDSLVKASVIDTDHKVFAMHGYKSRDRGNPRTEIFIREAGQLNLLDPPMPRIDEW